MPDHHSARAHAVFAYLLLDHDFTGATIGSVEALFGVLEPEELTHIVAVADQVSAVALALSARHQTAPDGVPPAAVAAAQREHERAIPQVYKAPGTVTASFDNTTGRFTPASPRQEISFEIDEGI